MTHAFEEGQAHAFFMAGLLNTILGLMVSPAMMLIGTAFLVECIQAQNRMQEDGQ